MKSHSLWVEKYRPTKLSEYVGNDIIKQKVGIYLESGDIPHLLLYGKAGTGKTTLAKLLVSNIDCDFIYINASDERGIDTIRNKIRGFASSIGFRNLKVVVLDESDALTPDSQAALRNLMETFSQHTRFILTCNYVEKIIDPIQSRCQSFRIVPPSKKEVAVRIVDILTKEGVSYTNEDLAVIVNSGYPDIRRIINSLQMQSIDGALAVDIQSIIENDYKVKLIHHLVTDGKKEAFVNIRQLLADSKVTDFTDLYRYLYDEVGNFAKGHIAPVILIIAEHQYMDSMVVDKEINVMAMIIKIIGEIK